MALSSHIKSSRETSLISRVFGKEFVRIGVLRVNGEASKGVFVVIQPGASQIHASAQVQDGGLFPTGRC
jgi:hypothetical protein